MASNPCLVVECGFHPVVNKNQDSLPFSLKEMNSANKGNSSLVMPSDENTSSQCLCCNLRKWHEGLNFFMLRRLAHGNKIDNLS